jgi:hypothetical protein
MNCLDCLTDPPGPWPFGVGPRPAVAICRDCGAGVCEVHAVIGTEAVTGATGKREVAADSQGRRIRCRQCDAALLKQRQVERVAA